MDKQLEEILRYLILACGEGADCVRQEAAECGREIPIGISNRHVHLCQEDLDTLFGYGYELTRVKDLSQPGQTACRESVTIAGPKGIIERLRILGPVREKTQVEVLAGDGFKLGVSGALRMSGDLEGTPGITIIGPKGVVRKKEGLIVAQRHIHMLPSQARRFGVKDGDIVDIRINGPRGGVLSNVAIRANGRSALECHVDTEEANAFGLTPSSTITIINAT